jgi:hypothetical protein
MEVPAAYGLLALSAFLVYIEPEDAQLREG